MTTYVLLKGSEDGNPLTWLSASELRELLADPSQWGVAEFTTMDKLNSNDPNYWPDRVGVLLRVDQVLPVPSGAYRIPDDDELAASGWVRGPVGPITLGGVS